MQPNYEPEYQFSNEYRIGGSWNQFRSKVYYSLGHIFLERRMNDSAAINLQHAIQLSSGFADAWIDLGTTFHSLNKSAQADSAFRKGLALQPSNFNAWLNYGILLEDMNRLEDARYAYNAALKHNPDFEPAKDRIALLNKNIRR